MAVLAAAMMYQSELGGGLFGLRALRQSLVAAHERRDVTHHELIQPVLRSVSSVAIVATAIPNTNPIVLDEPDCADEK